MSQNRRKISYKLLENGAYGYAAMSVCMAVGVVSAFAAAFTEAATSEVLTTVSNTSMCAFLLTGVFTAACAHLRPYYQQKEAEQERQQAVNRLYNRDPD